MGPAEPRRVGIIGAGAIGSAVAERLVAGAVPAARLAGVLVRSRRPPSVTPQQACATLEELLGMHPGVVVEAAGQAAVSDYGEAVLSAGADLVCVSVGALSDDVLLRRMERVAGERGTRLVLVSGAVGGLDVLRAAAEADIASVSVVQRKPARALLGEDEARALGTAVRVFAGSAREAVARFPATTNVMAAIALCGIGFDRTAVEVIADPDLETNHITLAVAAATGTIRVELQNAPSTNPRTSALAAMSVVAALRELTGPRLVLG
jgi:aspartate dehydrogenase